MSLQSYLIDTNVLIGLEDNHIVQPALAEFSKLAAKHKVNVFVHEAARDDIRRDKDDPAEHRPQQDQEIPVLGETEGSHRIGSGRGIRHPQETQ